MHMEVHGGTKKSKWARSTLVDQSAQRIDQGFSSLYRGPRGG